jgi:hypothetical protein
MPHNIMMVSYMLDLDMAQAQAQAHHPVILIILLVETV